MIALSKEIIRKVKDGYLEKEELVNYLMKSFSLYDILQNIDFEDDDWQEKVKGFMLPIEIRWMNLIDDIQDAVSDFLMDYKED